MYEPSAMPDAELKTSRPPGRSSTGSPGERVRFHIIVALYVLILVLVVGDRMVQDLRPHLIQLILAVLVVLDCPPPSRWRREYGWQRVGLTLAGLGLTLLAAEVCRRCVDRASQTFYNSDLEALARVWGDFFRYHVWVVWAAALWFFSPLALRSRELWCGGSRGANAGSGPPAAETSPQIRKRAMGRVVLLHTALLMGFGAWAVVTSVSSIRPDRGFRYFIQELGLYIPLYLFWLRIALRQGSYQHTFKRRACGILLLVTLVATLTAATVAIIYLGSDWNGRQQIEAFRFRDTIVMKREYFDRWEWRFNFPFGHHNRLGYFSMIGALVFLLIAGQGQRKWVRVVGGIGATLALVNLGLTLNRGAFVGLMAGLAVYLGMRLGRRVWWLLLLFPIALLILPQTQSARIASLFRKETYTNPNSTIATRFDHWGFAWQMMRENPVLGIGYGWKHFEKYYEHYTKRRGERVFHKSHAHNIWLQVGAESGWPGLLLWLGWHGTRWWLLIRLWRRRKRLDRAALGRFHLWLALEAAIQIYCMGNLPLRRALGWLTWGLWSVMMVDLLRLGAKAEESGSRSVTGMNRPTNQAESKPAV